jgi:hypothetical protein
MIPSRFSRKSSPYICQYGIYNTLLRRYQLAGEFGNKFAWYIIPKLSRKNRKMPRKNIKSIT